MTNGVLAMRSSTVLNIGAEVDPSGSGDVIGEEPGPLRE